MKRFCVWILLLFCNAAPAYAQLVGKAAVGVSGTVVKPTDDDVHRAVGVGITLARVPRHGWGVTGALNWFESDLEGTFAGVGQTIGTLRVRPLMGGVNYTVMAGRLAASFSVVAGPSFNKVHVDDAVRSRVDVADAEIVSVAVRPGLNLSYAVAPRFAITGFGGYMFNRPKYTFRTPAGEIRGPWKADALVLSAGVAVSLF